MKNPVTSRILLFLAGLILVPSVTYLVILFARGYRPNLVQKNFTPTGILVATSLPDGAQILVNGKLSSATNSTLNLSPGQYQIDIKKDGFQSWTKSLKIEAEVVTRAAATLFPTVPSLKAITSSGANYPYLSPDGTRVAFLSGSNLYTLDLSESPLGLLNRDPKLLSTFNSQLPTLIWSPDSKQILAVSTPSASLIDINQQTSHLVASPSGLLSNWNLIQKTRGDQKFTALPLKLQNILATAAADLVWSPKENKLLYTATASATIPDQLIRQLPGSSTQVQSRVLVEGKVYIYDTEEDRNFTIPYPQTNLQWFSDSSHLIYTEKSQVTIFEYDSTNSVSVYSGPMLPYFSIPYPSGKQLLILTNLSPASPSPSTSPVFNLYAISLR